MTRALVLGAQGFLGRHVLAELAANGLTATPGPTQEELDLVESPEADLHRLLLRERPDIVVNATGLTSGAAGDLYRHNVTTLERLSRACTASVPGARLVHLGSAAEYGPSPRGVPVREDVVPAPTTEYGRSKLAGTRVVLDAAARGDLDALVLRVFNPIGAGQPANSLAGRVLAQLSADPAAPVVVGSLDAVRDLVSARDVGRAAVAAALAPAPPPGARVVNIGSGRGVAVRELVEMLRRLAGHRGPLVETDGGSGRSTGVDWQQADVNRAATVIGWKAEDDLAAAAGAAVGAVGLPVGPVPPP